MKRIEEAAQLFESEHGEKIYLANIENKPDTNLCIESFTAGVEFSQRWIPVEEELPTEQGHYLVISHNSFPKNCKVMVAEFYDDNHVFYCEHSDRPIKDVTHWRPIEYK